VHGAAVARVEAGNRAAVNLVGLGVADVARGDILARPGTLRPTSIVDAELTLLPGERPLKDQARVRVHVASGEYLARVRVAAGSAVEPGATGPVQLRLERPAVAGRGDRLIVRSYSPAVTIGGALVVDPLATKKRRRDAPAPGPRRPWAAPTPRARPCSSSKRRARRGSTPRAWPRG
jgi:selenocysteine-specific elongation factor